MKITFNEGKKFLLFAFLTVSGLGYGQYCAAPEVDCSLGDEIQNVTFAGINNATGCADEITGYSDYTTGTAAALTTGQTYTISVTVGSGGTEAVAVFIDFNQNQIFEADEMFSLGSNEGGTLTTTIAIPETALAGPTRLRVRNTYVLLSDPETLYDVDDAACVDLELGYGETEDYTVNIAAGVPCTGTPEIGAISASETTVCGGQEFTVSATVGGTSIGFSYQLQVSTDGGTTWVDSGAANTTGNFTVTQSVPTSYQVIVTCVASSETDMSTSVAIGQNAAEGCYCTPSDTNDLNCEDGDIMTNVTFGALNNDSGCGEYGYTNYYSAFAAVELTAGETYPISVTVGPSGEGWEDESVGVWIDYNHDGFFSADEFTYVGTGLAETLTGDIVIPETALEGETRMRVLVSATLATGFDTTYSCSPLSPINNFGEIEDYLVNITNDLSAGEFKNGLVGMYPNPAQDVVNFTVNNGVSLQSAEIYNVTGQVVGRASFASATEGNMDVSGLSAGVYIVKLTTDKGSVSQRLVKK